jgi:glycosyltransferase involved in cell wall biosynthesis
MAATFSICIPLFDGGATIERALESLVAQTDRDWECIVVDDASTDDSLVRARRVTDPRITVQAMPSNVGMTPNWNRALATATGTYTILLGHDDALAPQALATLRDVFARHPDAAMVAFGAVVPVDDGPDRLSSRRHIGRIEPADLAEFALRTSDTPAPSQAAYRTSALRALLPLDEAFRYCPEIDLQHRLGEAGHAAVFLADCIGVRGNDPGRITERVRHTAVPLRDHYRLLQKHARRDPRLTAHQRRVLRRRAARQALHALRHGRARVALSFLKTVADGERRLPR